MVSRLEIVENVLDYLRKNDVKSAIEYLENVKQRILDETKRSIKRERKPLEVRCMELVRKNKELRRKIMEVAKTMQEE